MKVAIIGGGAAGFFSAINVKTNYPEATVIIFEKLRKLLTKIKASGGGRCNVTNGCTSVSELIKAYPRGRNELKKAFHVFNTTHTREWFESRGVQLYVQDDNRVFPVSQDSQTIIDCLMRETKKLGISIEMGVDVKSIVPKDNQLELVFGNASQESQIFDKVIVATGGSPFRAGLEWLEALNHKIENPVPSLFTFRMPNESVTELTGVSVENALVSIQGTKLKSDGPLLITHWGMSGPAILKLSSFGARILSEMAYDFKVQVNWACEPNNDVVMEQLRTIIKEHGNKLLPNNRPYQLTTRLWNYLLEKVEVPLTKTWVELSKKELNKLVNVLTCDVYAVKGQTSFKDEFVTCGGVSLQSIDLETMQSKVCKNLYFAGEIMDVDAITGGYNFQNAWTTGFIAGKLK